MEIEDVRILDAVIGVVTRYGMKRTTMSELAQQAGVSRQTLYDKYGDKDGIMAAAVRLMGKRLCADLQKAFAAERDLVAKIDDYYTIAVWPIFDVLQAMPDAADFEKGLGPASIAAGDEAARRKQALLTDMLTGYLPKHGPSPAEVAAFIEQSSSRAKGAATSRDELARFLEVLKSAVVALAESGLSEPGKDPL